MALWQGLDRNQLLSLLASFPARRANRSSGTARPPIQGDGNSFLETKMGEKKMTFIFLSPIFLSTRGNELEDGREGDADNIPAAIFFIFSVRRGGLWGGLSGNVAGQRGLKRRVSPVQSVCHKGLALTKANAGRK
jgi:hypothetical protein